MTSPNTSATAPVIGNYIVVTNNAGNDRNYVRTSRGLVDVTGKAWFSLQPTRFQPADIAGIAIFTGNDFVYFGADPNKNYYLLYDFTPGPQPQYKGAKLSFVPPPAQANPFNLAVARNLPTTELPDIDTGETALTYVR